MASLLPMTHGTGMGPLPDLLEAGAGGRAISRVFAAQGIPVGLIEDRSHWVPLAAFAGVFDGAARATGDRIFGLRVGLEMAPSEYGLWARYALQAPTLGGALERLSRYMHLHQIGGELGVAYRRDGRVAMIYHHRLIHEPGYIHHTDHVLPVMMRVVRSYLGPAWVPDAVEVPYPDPGDGDRREALTGTRWLFGRKRAALVMPVGILNHARVQAQTGDAFAPVTSAEVLGSAVRLDSTDMSEQLGAILALRLLDRLTDIDGAAQMMGVSRRTLQRRLDAEGVSYSERLDAVRLGRAWALVEETALPLTAIAFDVGYSDPAHFTRAFRRYFGCAPSQLRQGRMQPGARDARDAALVAAVP